MAEPVDDDGDVTPVPDTEAGAGRGGHLVAVVTGASRGIGRAIANALEDDGWVVERGSSTVAPMTDRAALTAWVDEIVERQGRIDLLVNNAGVMDAEVDLFASDPDEWWHQQEVNVRGVYLMTWLVAPHMVAAGGGRVVNLNSGAGRVPGELASGYNVSKAALARITGATHLAGRDRGIRAFDLMPGVVRTDMTAVMDAHADRTDWTSAEDVAAFVLVLASGALDAFSGRFVRVGDDTVESLQAMAARGLDDRERTLDLVLRPDDPLA
ncbi:SDR family oxidoreductase [Phycicoccus sp. MQZ13P-5]|uniref:SDR family oxidoreductase n=1 Tax=Phycicoccus sonneratiae TaxID=2807628 RepID=A0ABS2CIS5_9MICO|nr:SDR family oxidoreductase [Phycicoccus sonneraticus]